MSTKSSYILIQITFQQINYHTAQFFLEFLIPSNINIYK